MPRKVPITKSVMTTAEAADYLGVSKSKLEKKRLYSEDGPPFVADDGSVRYRRVDLDAWLGERLFRSARDRARRRKPKN